MSILKVIKSRRSVRFWDDRNISNDIINKLITAAKWAPSSCNRQPISFLIINNEKDKEVIINSSKGSKFCLNANKLILVLANLEAYSNKKEKRYSPYLDGAAAIQNLLLMAHGLNLGSCWVNMGVNEIAKGNMKKIKKYFNIPKEKLVISMVALGYPDKKSQIIPRKDNKDILFFNKI